MKHFVSGLAITAITMVACNNATDNKEAGKNKTDNKDSIAISQKQSITGDTVASQVPGNNSSSFSIKKIIEDYLQLKNALSNDNSQNAAVAGNSLVATLAAINPRTLSPGEQKDYGELQETIKEDAEHIGANAGKIEHQREHFITLSNDVADLIKTFGNGGQPLYKDFCPMANEGKGATWISEVEKISNPYYGKKMPGCGTVKETYK